METEPLRLPAWSGIVLAALVAGLTALQTSGSWLAATVATLGVIAPTGTAVELARKRVWSPASVKTAVANAAVHGARQGHRGLGGAVQVPAPEELLTEASTDPYTWTHPRQP